MNISAEKRSAIIAYEAFIRRAATLDLPFMLKGSYVTRQYFSNPEDRIPNDLDWVYLNRLEYKDDATGAFDEWMIMISEMYENDGVHFRSFRENRFWRMIDYAMADDFPTVNTDLDCWVDGESIYPCHLDISFNLPVDIPPVTLSYTPLRGNTFSIPNTVPLTLQVSWKLHQTLVRARFKDLFDLMHLVVHPAFTPDVLQETLQALVKECAMGNTDVARLNYLLNGDWDELFNYDHVNLVWDYWRHGRKNSYISSYIPFEDRVEMITNPNKLPVDLAVFKEQFKQAFETAGFYNIDLKTLVDSSWSVKIAEEERIVEQKESAPAVNKVEPDSTTQKQRSRFGFLRRLFKRS